MAKTSTTDGLTLAQLERLMNTRKAEVTRLRKQRERLLLKLAKLDERISAASGGAAGGGVRPRNRISLQDAILQVLGKGGGAMGVGDIMEKVEALGYTSTSANFRGIVNQTLIKDKRFVNAGRGLYQLKK